MSSGTHGEGEGSGLAPCSSGFLVTNSGELCAGVMVCVPTERALSATSGTRAIGSSPLVYGVERGGEI